MQILNSIDFLQYLWIIGFKGEKDEKGGVEDKGQEEEDEQGELEEGAMDVNLLLNLAKVQ